MLLVYHQGSYHWAPLTEDLSIEEKLGCALTKVSRTGVFELLAKFEKETLDLSKSTVVKHTLIVYHEPDIPSTIARSSSRRELDPIAYAQARQSGSDPLKTPPAKNVPIVTKAPTRSLDEALDTIPTLPPVLNVPTLPSLQSLLKPSGSIRLGRVEPCPEPSHSQSAGNLSLPKNVVRTCRRSHCMKPVLRYQLCSNHWRQWKRKNIWLDHP